MVGFRVCLYQAILFKGEPGFAQLNTQSSCTWLVFGMFDKSMGSECMNNEEFVQDGRLVRVAQHVMGYSERGFGRWSHWGV